MNRKLSGKALSGQVSPPMSVASVLRFARSSSKIDEHSGKLEEHPSNIEENPAANLKNNQAKSKSKPVLEKVKQECYGMLWCVM